jgi:hypothetical protein
MKDTFGINFFRPAGACNSFLLPTHGLRRGLHSCAASRLTCWSWSKKRGVRSLDANLGGDKAMDNPQFPTASTPNPSVRVFGDTPAD